MRVALGGMFRNSTWYLPRYFKQVDGLRRALAARGHSLQLVMAEGDSDDGTWEKLAWYTVVQDAVLVKRAHGGPWWGSADRPDRWTALSWVCNGVLDHVARDVDALVYVETDLVWKPETMLALLDHLVKHPAVSPMCFTGVGDFYDIWGHIKDGVNFSPFPPYHEALEGMTVRDGAKITPTDKCRTVRMDSTGSCVVMRGDVARVVRYGPHDLVRGLGRSIYENGFSLWLDPSLKVVHL